MKKVLFAAVTMCAAIAAAHADSNHLQLAQADTSTKGVKTPAQPNETQPGQTENQPKGSDATSRTSKSGRVGRSTGTGATATDSGTGAGASSGDQDDGGRKTNRTRRARQMKG